MFLFDWIKKLLERLRGKKRSRKEILRAHNRAIRESTKPQINKPIEPPISHEPPISYEPPPPPQEKNLIGFVLDIKNAEDFGNYSATLNNLRGFEEFQNISWLRVRLDRIKKSLSGLNAPDDFDGEFNFKLACKVRDVAKTMLEVYSYAKSSTNIGEDSRRQLVNMVEDYLLTVGLTKKNFKVGDAFDDWADLNMPNSYDVIPTNNYDLNGKIDSVKIQPHTIFYRGEFGDIENLTFGGSCLVYKFKTDYKESSEI